MPNPTSKAVYSRLRALHVVVVHALSSPPPEFVEQVRQSPEESEKTQSAYLEKISSLQKSKVWNWMTDREQAFLTSDPLNLDPEEQIALSWRIEAAQVLLWALGLLDELPAYGPMAEHEIFQSVPDYSWKLIYNGPQLRSPKEILAARDTAELWHWRARTRQLSDSTPELPPEILQAGYATYDDIVRETARSAHEQNVIPELIEEDFAVEEKAYRDLEEDLADQVHSIIMERHFALNWLCGYASRNRWEETPTST